MPLKLQDLRVPDITTALPAAAGTVYSTAVDLEKLIGESRDFLAQIQLEITIPDLTVAQMVNADTLTIALLTKDANGTLSSGATVVYEALKVFVGAGGVGCTGATFYVVLPTTIKRYVGIRAIHAGTGVPSTANATTKVKF
jgi:hypothetical protein